MDGQELIAAGSIRCDAAQTSHFHTPGALSRHVLKSRSVIDSNFRLGGDAYADLLVDR